MSHNCLDNHAIKVNNVSKRFRIGINEEQSDTFIQTLFNLFLTTFIMFVLFLNLTFSVGNIISD